MSGDEKKAAGGAAATPFGLPISPEDQQLLDKYERQLTGSVSHTLDSKGRLVVPAVYRDSLGSGFCIAPSQNFRSIAIYSAVRWAHVRESYAMLASRNSSLIRFLEYFDALSFRGQECDGQGRVLLPAKIRSLILGDEKDVEISGAGDHIRVAAASKDKDDFASFMNALPDILSDINTLEAQNSHSV